MTSRVLIISDDKKILENIVPRVEALAECYSAVTDDFEAAARAFNIDCGDDWLDTCMEEKEFKLFRRIYNKKLEEVIAPVFYRLEKANEDKEIEQYTGLKESVFRIKNNMVKIVYCGLGKVNIYTIYEGLDSPENTEVTIPLGKLTQKELTKIVEDFICSSPKL
ncbi:MAG: hypothetical protein LBJ74_00705 [Heliobacteriaceae bacterium]|jgi:hypothetical protein|nr:hypothetical protein [Heliobacteriaceae bacterium]